MKLQIINNNNEEISGFISIPISNRQDISKIVHNSCTEIIAFNVMDKLPYNDAIEFLISLLSRVRLGGTITIGGINFISLAQNIVSGDITSEETSELISNTKSVIDTRIINKILESNKFVVDHLLLLDKYYYELRASRNTL
jgi:hypothetical protein